MQFRTRAIHVGQEADPSNGAVVPPIHLASTFVCQLQAVMPSTTTLVPVHRHDTPSGCDGFARRCARGLAFASGMAATHCVSMLLKPGDHLVTGTDIYGGSWRLFNNVLSERASQLLLSILQILQR